MSTTACESRRRDKEVSDEEVSAPRVASGAERHRSGHQTCHFQELSKNFAFVVQLFKSSAALPPEIPDDDSSVAAP